GLVRLNQEEERSHPRGVLVLPPRERLKRCRSTDRLEEVERRHQRLLRRRNLNFTRAVGFGCVKCMTWRAAFSKLARRRMDRLSALKLPGFIRRRAPPPPAPPTRRFSARFTCGATAWATVPAAPAAAGDPIRSLTVGEKIALPTPPKYGPRAVATSPRPPMVVNVGSATVETPPVTSEKSGELVSYEG